MSTSISIRILLLCAIVCSAIALSANNAGGSSRKPVKRVAIVGSGIAGLSLAHALTNSDENLSDMEVCLFDSRKELDYGVGSGVQLNGGMCVLGKINRTVQKSVIDAAVSVDGIESGTKSWFKDESDTLWKLSLENVIRKAGGETEELLIEDGKVMWYAIMRGALQEVLVKSLPQDDGTVKMALNKCLTGIRDGQGGAVLDFSDGTSSEPFDLVVGCDGVKSAVKEYVEKGKISRDASMREGNAAALYSGIRVGYAVRESDTASDNEPIYLNQVFADGGYALSGTYGNGANKPPCKCFFITSLDEKFNGPFLRKETTLDSPVNENADWTQDKRKPIVETKQQMIEKLDIHQVPNDGFSSMIEKSDQFFELGVYFHNPFSLSGWSKKVPSTDDCHAVLCGDAAHAMPPFLGQGANQAIQDAYLLAKKIHVFNAAIQSNGLDAIDTEKTDGPKDLKQLLKEYERTRWLPTTIISAKAAILGYLETGGRDGFYSKFRDVFFRALFLAGVPQKVLMSSATPKVK